MEGIKEMKIYLLIVLVSYMFLLNEFVCLFSKDRADLISIDLKNAPYKAIFTALIVSFAPIFRLVFIIFLFYLCICKEEVIEKLKK